MLYFLICRHWYNRSKYGNVSHSNCQRQRREQYQCLPVFIGHDLPAVPAQVTLVATDADDTHLTWTVPTAGTNGGMDRRGVARIRHYPAAYLTALCLEEDSKGTEYTDTTIENLATYFYQVP